MAEVILSPGSFLDLRTLTPDECADRARKAGYDGIEWIPTRTFASHNNQAMMEPGTRASIKAAQQSFRTEKGVGDMIKWVKDHPSWKAPLIVAGVFISFQERIESLDSIRTLQNTVLGRPLMVNVFPPHHPTDPTGTEYGFAAALVQPGKNAMERLEAKTLSQLELRRQEFGYDWLIDPSFAQELGDLKDVLPVLAPNAKMIRLCPKRIDMFENPNVDYPKFLRMMRDLTPDMPMISVLMQGASTDKLLRFRDSLADMLA